MKAGTIALLVLAPVLIGAVTLQLRALSPRTQPDPQGSPLRAIPQEFPGHVVRDLPLAETELSANETAQILRMDDYVYREFAGSGGRFTVYAAYWRSGKMPTQVVASHNPDRCWTSAGWSCLERRLHVVGVEGQFPPGQFRIFRAPSGARVQVVFWHMVGGRVYDASDRFGRIPNPYYWWRDVVRRAKINPGEQIFLRVTSEEALENVERSPALRQVLTVLAQSRP